jgi:DNA-directed RNA polymerase specialized sigma24 family protein
VENTDWLDVKASVQGDEDAYERLVRRYEKQITGLLWRFTRDPVQCEELVQQVFVEAYFSLKTYRGDAPLLHWLRRIATRTGYRFWREKAVTWRFPAGLCVMERSRRMWRIIDPAGRQRACVARPAACPDRQC